MHETDVSVSVELAAGRCAAETLGEFQHILQPEQAFAEKDIDGRSDMYSLACVLYEMLTGQPPFTGANAQSIMAKHSMAEVPSMQIVRNTIPDEVEDVVQRDAAAHGGRRVDRIPAQLSRQRQSG